MERPLDFPAQRDHRSRPEQDHRGLLHDVGHGLATVALLLEAARGGAAPTFGNRLLDLVEAETDRLLSTIHTGLRTAGSTEAVAVRPVLEQIVELAGHTRATAVMLDPGADVVLPLGPVLLWRVVTNVVGNAVRAAGPDGHVRIALTRQDNGTVHVDVLDDGPGFAHAPSASPGPGTGLGVVTRPLSSCGGRLEIDDVHPRGTRARITLTPDLSPLPEGADRARPGAL